MALSDMLEKMREDPSKYLKGVSSGAQFERAVESALFEEGYAPLSPESAKQALQKIKEDIQDETRQGPILNTTGSPKQPALLGREELKQKQQTFQPYSTQQYPDIIVFEKKHIVPVEVKTADKEAPVWNGGLPRQEGLYIFGSRNQITFFRGGDLISPREAKKLLDYFRKMKQLSEDLNKEMAGQAYGFTVYNRKAFQQSRKFNRRAIINLFTNPDKGRLEENAIRTARIAEGAELTKTLPARPGMTWILGF